MGVDGRVSGVYVCEFGGALAGVEDSNVGRKGGEGGSKGKAKQGEEEEATDRESRTMAGGREGERTSRSQKRGKKC